MCIYPQRTTALKASAVPLRTTAELESVPGFATLHGPALLPIHPSRQLPGWPYCAPDEISAAVRVLKSGRINYWTGNEGRKFETEFARQAGCKRAVALSNGSVALELALYALGVGEMPAAGGSKGSEDEVITTARGFVASASCVVMRGARPVMVDVDPESQNVTAETIRAAITPRTRAIIAVHLAGWPCDMDPIMALAREHGLKVIEDCAQAHGAIYKGRPVGSMGHAAAFSFCQDKILTTGGEGGMLTTNDDVVWEKAWSYKDHGKRFEAAGLPPGHYGFRWLHESFGTNMRMTEMQAAIGRVALRKLPDWVKTRRRNAAILHRYLEPLEAIRVTRSPAEILHSYYKYYAFVKPERLKKAWCRDRIIAEVNECGIPCGSGSCGEIYLEKAFSADLRPRRRLPVARQLGETGLMFLVHPTLSGEDMRYAGEIVARVVREATK